MESVRIGVIGLGWFGEIHCDAIQATPGLELAALCTRTESRLSELGRKYGVEVLETDYRALLGRNDLDAVSIVTMWDQHTEPTLAALAAGKHVFPRKADGVHGRGLRAHRGGGGGGAGALREEFLYFARCVRDGTPPSIITPAESMEAVRTTLAAERSAETGEVVRLD